MALGLLHQPALGHAAALGLWFSCAIRDGDVRLRFDWLGFAVLRIGIGGLQLMLDRGGNGWFDSRKSSLETVIAGLGFYLFFIHMMSRRASP